MDVGRICRAASALLAVAIAACADRPLPVEPGGRSLGSAIAAGAPDSVFNRWIVLFRDDVTGPASVSQQLIAAHGGHPIHFYEHVVKGFAVANLPDAAVVSLRANAVVRLVEESLLVPQTAVQYLPLDNYNYQTSSLWSLDRVHVRPLSFDGQFEYAYTGSGVHIYILDSGIRCSHQEFTGRIGEGVTRLSFSWGANPCIDQDGHGTGVASSAGGTTYGIAKGAILHSVRINDNDDAYCDDIVAGFDWVGGNAIRPAVANLSYGGVPSCFSIRDAIEGVIAAGITVTKSAGNAPYDAYDDRGNRATNAIMVGASDYNDYRATFSSGLATYGNLITLFAPGYRVGVAGIGHDSDSRLAYGSSFSAPYVAGVAATYLQQIPSASPNSVLDMIRGSATTGVLSNIGPGSPNRFLHTSFRSVAISGPSSIASDVEGSYSWTSQTTGGSASSYVWEISINGGGFSTVSTTSSYSRTIYPGESYDFELRLTAMIAGDARTDNHFVRVIPPPEEPPCAPGEMC